MYLVFKYICKEYLVFKYILIMYLVFKYKKKYLVPSSVNNSYPRTCASKFATAKIEYSFEMGK